MALVAICLCFSTLTWAQSPLNLTYKVQWKWGLVDLSVGNAYVNINFEGDNMFGTLAGQSIPWESRVYSVGDTLQASVTPTQESIQYINGWYRKPHVNERVDTDKPSHYRTIMGQGTLSASPSTMEAVDITANMISIFYYVRAIGLESMQPGQCKTVQIYSPTNPRGELSITYNDTGADTSGQAVYKITFNYPYQGRRSNYPVQCWVRCSDLVPVYIAADIKIGHVSMTLSPE